MEYTTHVGRYLTVAVTGEPGQSTEQVVAALRKTASDYRKANKAKQKPKVAPVKVEDVIGQVVKGNKELEHPLFGRFAGSQNYHAADLASEIFGENAVIINGNFWSVADKSTRKYLTPRFSSWTEAMSRDALMKHLRQVKKDLPKKTRVVEIRRKDYRADTQPASENLLHPSCRRYAGHDVDYQITDAAYKAFGRKETRVVLLWVGTGEERRRAYFVENENTFEKLTPEFSGFYLPAVRKEILNHLNRLNETRAAA